MPDLSVIIPAHNSEAFVGQAIISVMRESPDVSLEVIVVDDGSTDGTRDAVAPFGNAVRYVRQEQSGAGVARNRGAESARGDVYYFLDSDDSVAWGALPAALDRLRERPTVAVAYGICAERHASGALSVPAHPCPASDGNLFGPIVRGNTLVPSQYVVRRSAFERSGGFPPSIPRGQDWAFILRVARDGEFTFMNRVFVEKGQHADSLTFTAAYDDFVETRLGILRQTFGNEAAWVEKEWLSRRVFAEWYRAYGLDCALRGDVGVARRNLLKSLKCNLWQPPLLLWLLRHCVTAKNE